MRGGSLTGGHNGGHERQRPRGPIGQPITVPQDVTSVTIIFRGTEELKALQARRAEKRGKGKRERAAGRGKGARGQKRREEGEG